MHVNAIAGRNTCYEPSLGVTKHAWGWRIMLIWFHVCIHTAKGAK